MKYFSSILTTSVLALFLGAVSALAWTGPTAAPPQGNVSAPLNTSSMGQAKSGGLSLGTGTVDTSTLLYLVSSLFPQIKVQGTGNTGLFINRPSSSYTGQIRLLTAGMDSWSLGIGSNNNDFLLYSFNPPLGLTNRLTVGVGGNVGIGVLSPTAKLDVSGTVKATGLQITTGAGLNRVLTSNDTGVATWQNAGSLTEADTLDSVVTR